MKNSNCKLLGYNVCILNKNDIVDKINKSKDRNIIFNLNPIIMVNFNNNIEYKEFINNEKYNIPDGYGTILGMKINGNKEDNQYNNFPLEDIQHYKNIQEMIDHILLYRISLYMLK